MGRHHAPSALRAVQAPWSHGKVTMPNKTAWIGLVAAVLLCSCALQDDVYTLDHRLSALERRNLELEKQNRELETLNQDLVQAKESMIKQECDLPKRAFPAGSKGWTRPVGMMKWNLEGSMPGWLPRHSH